MRKITLFIILLSFFISFSQSNEKFEYQKYSNPDTKNDLSLYFKDKISKSLLKKARYFKNRNNIILSFNINNENKPYQIMISTYGSSELYSKIKEAFEKYPLKKLNLETLDKKNRYSLQVISKIGTKNRFNCSSKIIIETPPICEPCNDLDSFKDIETCLKIEVEKHFYSNFDFSVVNEDDTNIYFQYFVDKTGNLKLKKQKKPIKYANTIKNTLNTFLAIQTQGTFNQNPNTPSYILSINYKEYEENVFKDKRTEIFAFSKPTADNDFALYLSNKLSEQTIAKANLNRINNRLYISFELDKNNKPFNISTNSRSNFLEEKIISNFKDYSIKKLNFINKNPFNSYVLEILSFESPKTVIKTSSVVAFERVPLFPECEVSKSIKEAKKCFSKVVQMHFLRKFDTDLPNQLGLSKGRKRVFIAFKIDTEGNINGFKVRAPHTKIKEEVIRVMKQLPKAKPALQSGKKTSIKYSIPFTLIVE